MTGPWWALEKCDAIRILMWIDENGGACKSECIDDLMLNNVTAGRRMMELAQDGLIEIVRGRTHSGPMYLFTTEKGKIYARHLAEAAAEAGALGADQSGVDSDD